MTAAGLPTEARQAPRRVQLEPRPSALGLVERLAWPGFLALIACWAVGYLMWPFSTDQGILSWVGGVMAGGGAPYRDAWEIRGPAPFFVYAAIARVFGTAQWPLRAVDLAFVAAGAWCIARITVRFGGRTAVRSAVLLYLLWYASLGHHDTAQSDGWNAVMIAGVVVALFSSEDRQPLWHAAIAGALLGLCVVSKPPYAAFFSLPVAFGIGQWRARGAMWVVRFWAVGALAAIASAGIVLSWLARHDAFAPFIDIHFRWLLSQYTDVESSWLNRLQTAATFLTTGKFATALVAAVIGMVTAWRSRRDLAAIFALWVAGALLSVTAQGNFYPYHWHPLYPPLAILAGMGIGVLYTEARGNRGSAGRVTAAAAAGIALGAAALLPVVHVYRLVLFGVGIMPADGFERVEFGPFGERTGVFAQLAGYLRTHSAPNETVQIWGSVPGVNYVAGRRPPTRFGYVVPVTSGVDDEFRRRYRREFLGRIAAAPPTYVVALDTSVCQRAPTIEARRLIGLAEALMKCLDELPAFQALVQEDYVAESRIGSMVVYRRLGTAAAAKSVAEPRNRELSAMPHAQAAGRPTAGSAGAGPNGTRASGQRSAR